MISNSTLAKSFLFYNYLFYFFIKYFTFYFAKYFTEPEKYVKQINKTQHVAEYRVIVDNLFREQEWEQK